MQPEFRPSLPEPFRLMGVEVAPLAGADDTEAAWEVIHQTVSPGAGSPLHTLATDKLFVVLDGELGLVVDGVEHPATAGATATVPAGTPHRFVNRSAAPARLLVVTTGTGHVAFLEGLARLGQDGPPAQQAVVEHARAHHVELLV